MTTFCLQDIKRAEAKRSSKENPYSIDNNIESFEMSLKGRQERGEMIEDMVAYYLNENLGIPAEVTSLTAPYDISFRVNDRRYKRGYKIHRIEVKSALQNAKGNYLYQAIKPNNFDYIFFCEVNPKDGIICKWTTRKAITKFNSKFKRKANALGYAILIKDLRTGKLRNGKHTLPLYDLDEFPHDELIETESQ